MLVTVCLNDDWVIDFFKETVAFIHLFHTTTQSGFGVGNNQNIGYYLHDLLAACTMDPFQDGKGGTVERVWGGGGVGLGRVMMRWTKKPTKVYRLSTQ